MADAQGRNPGDPDYDPSTDWYAQMLAAASAADQSANAPIFHQTSTTPTQSSVPVGNDQGDTGASSQVGANGRTLAQNQQIANNLPAPSSTSNVSNVSSGNSGGGGSSNSNNQAAAQQAAATMDDQISKLLQAMSATNEQDFQEKIREFNADLNLRQQQFNATQAENARQFNINTETGLVNTASKLGGPADYFHYLTAVNGGRDVLASLNGNQGAPAFGALAGNTQPQSLGTIFDALGLNGSTPTQAQQAGAQAAAAPSSGAPAAAAGGAPTTPSGQDIIVPAGMTLDQAVQAGVLSPTDANRIGNMSDIPFADWWVALHPNEPFNFTQWITNPATASQQVKTSGRDSSQPLGTVNGGAGYVGAMPWQTPNNGGSGTGYYSAEGRYIWGAPQVTSLAQAGIGYGPGSGYVGATPQAAPATTQANQSTATQTPQYPAAGTSADGSKLNLPYGQGSLPYPNQISPAVWNSYSKEMQDFVKGAYSAAGYGDITSQIQNQAPSSTSAPSSVSATYQAPMSAF